MPSMSEDDLSASKYARASNAMTPILGNVTLVISVPKPPVPPSTLSQT